MAPDPEYDALVIQIASWLMRQARANEYLSLAQLVKQLAEDVTRLAS